MGVLDLADIIRVLDYSAPPGVRGVMYVFHAGGDTLAALFSDANLTFLTSNPVRGNAGGVFPEIHLSGGVYRVEVYDDQEKLLLFSKDQVVINDKDTLGVNHGFYNMDSLLRSRRLSYDMSSDLTRPARENDIVFVADGSFTFQVAGAATTDYDMITDAGVRLNALGSTLTPTQFGVLTGTGLSPEVGQRNVQQLNKMLARAAALGSKVYFPAGATIEIANGTEPLKIPSQIAVEGNRCFIQAQDDTGPIIVSKAWADNTAVGGQGKVDGLIARGTLTNAEISAGVGSPNSQDGFIVFDYHSRWTNCEAWRCKGRGIVAEERNSSGAAAYGTLVENRFEDCIARKCVGRGFDMAPAGLGKLTDGWLLDPIVEQPNGSTAEAIALNVSAGWRLQGAHTYSGNPETAILVANAWCTEIGALYIESFEKTGLLLSSVQQSLGVGKLKLRANIVSKPDAAAVQVSRSSAVSEAHVAISAIQIEKGVGTVPLDLIRNATGGATMMVNLGSYYVKGSNASYVLPVADSADWLWVANRTRVLGQLRDASAEKRISYQGLQLLQGLQLQWNGGGAQAVAFSVPYVSNYHQNRKMVCDLTIFSFQNQNGTRRCFYKGTLLISGRDSGGTWKVDLVNVVTPSGFSVPPAVGTVTVTGTQSGTNPLGMNIQITFTPTDSDGYGAASLVLGPTLGV